MTPAKLVVALIVGAAAVVRAGATGVSVINTLLGMVIDTETRRPALGAGRGGLLRCLHPRRPPAGDARHAGLVQPFGQPALTQQQGLGVVTAGATAGAGVITATVLQWTGQSPSMDIMERARRWEARQKDTYVSVFYGYPWSDVPDVGATVARELILSEKCEFLIGPTSSGVALAVTKVAKEFKKIVYFL